MHILSTSILTSMFEPLIVKCLGAHQCKMLSSGNNIDNTRGEIAV